MLLKYRAQAPEIQEGVAFFGRAGAAVLKSVKRLAIDPLVIYGTNCVKCADAQPGRGRRRCPPWLLARSPSPSPRSSSRWATKWSKRSTISRFRSPSRSTPRAWARSSISPPRRGTRRPDLDACLNDEESKRRFWQAFKALGRGTTRCPRTSPRRRVVRLDRLGRSSTGPRRCRPWPVRRPRRPAARGSAASPSPPASTTSGRCIGTTAVGLVLAVGGTLADLPTAAGLGKILAAGRARHALHPLLDRAWHVAVVALLVMGVDTYSVFAGPTKQLLEQGDDVISTSSRCRSPRRACTARPASASPTSCSWACSAARPCTGGCGRG